MLASKPWQRIFNSKTDPIQSSPAPDVTRRVAYTIACNFSQAPQYHNELKDSKHLLSFQPLKNHFFRNANSVPRNPKSTPSAACNPSTTLIVHHVWATSQSHSLPHCSPAAATLFTKRLRGVVHLNIAMYPRYANHGTIEH
jgi:hypothetical protein